MIVMNFYYRNVLSKLYNDNNISTQKCVFHTIPRLSYSDYYTLANAIMLKIKFIMYQVNK